jgi:energy-coupling factor transport system ATP-binding protein
MVLANLNLKLEPGKVYRLAGPNGAGKSTLARILCGILRLNSGRIFVNGSAFDPYPHPGTLVRLHFQNPDAQLFGEPVRNELSSLPPSLREAAALFAGLIPFLDTHPFDLPFVLRKRLALTLIFHTVAPWLIFDEPTVGLDEEAQSIIAACIDRLASAGYGVIFISHNERLTRLLSPVVLSLESNSHEE